MASGVSSCYLKRTNYIVMNCPNVSNLFIGHHSFESVFGFFLDTLIGVGASAQELLVNLAENSYEKKKHVAQ